MFVRWSNLRIDEEEGQSALPGYREPAVVRHFDAPEALDTRFYEVRSKSALNRVPAASRMPFRWTINPYRGCSHACVYCLDGDTLIQLADGRQRPLRDIRIGDRIYGTTRVGSYRRYAETEVLAHWRTKKPAYSITLADGTRLIASGDHRFLTGRGWKFVTGAMSGAARRPYLTLNDTLLGVGAMPATPPETGEYRQGYLAGMIRGAGHVGTYHYARAGRPNGSTVHRFRLALIDIEPLARTRWFLDAIEIATDEFVFAHAGPGVQRTMAIRTSKGAAVDAVREAIAWLERPDAEWERGFVAGIFDAEGSYSGGILRISNGDPQMIQTTVDALERDGFDVVVERLADRPMMYVRVRGGLREHVRFFQRYDPATTRKRVFAGQALKSAADLRVVSVESLGEVRQMYDITTGTGDFIANGVVSHNCFARPTHTYLGFDAGRDFDKEIVVKVNAPEVVRAELARPSWRHEHVAMGTNTDPYQWVESRYRLMPPILEALRDSGTPCSVLTKSPLILRDLDLLRTFAQRGVDFSAAFSVPTLEEKAWRASEPHTPHPRKRLEAVRALTEAGIPVSVLVAPLMPGINDDPRQVEKILATAGEMGAVHTTGICLHLRGEVRGVFMDWLRTYRPDLVSTYEEIYARGAYAPADVRDRMTAMVRRGRPAPRWRRQARPVAASAPKREPAVQERLF